MPKFDAEAFVKGLQKHIADILSPLAERVKVLESRPVEKGDTGATGERGEKGDQGAEGPQGLPGEKGEKGDTGAPGENGKDGQDGAPGTNGEKGMDGVPGRDAPTADEIALLFERRFSDQLISMEQRFTDAVQKSIGAIPKPKDGRDALELEDFDLVLADDGRTVTLSLKRGEVLVEKSVKIAAIIDRGVFEPEGKYEKGDAVTFGGSLWIAQVDAPTGTPGGSPDFRLAVKRGRDGKDLRPNASTHDPSKGVSIK